jgi:hypothetical protein
MHRLLPGETFTFRNPNTKADIDQIVSQVVKIIRGANPFMDSIEVWNKTKGCTVDIVFTQAKLQIIFRNPKDEEFDLNEHENPVITRPVVMTGR